MAAFTAIELMAMDAPELASGTVTKNGLTFTIPIFLQKWLDTANGDVNLALSLLYEALTSMEFGREIRLGDFSTSRMTSMQWSSFFDERRYFYDRKYRGAVMQQQGVAPTLGAGWYSYGNPGFPWTG